MNIVLEEQWGFLEIFLAELYFVACCKRQKRWKPEFWEKTKSENQVRELGNNHIWAVILLSKW